MYRIRILDAATRDLARLDKPTGRRIVDRIKRLAANPQSLRLAPLKGELSGLYKLRVGDYRVLYEIIHDEQLIMIHVIGHRREIYRKR
ncbi:MAG: type II toxin-antitoxin system RelE/ParE family toxin [bacterium]